MVYNIKSLKCSYDGSGDLIHIDNLSIDEGSIYFFLGKSGVGKSTLLEALGLMNNTLTPDSETLLNIEGKYHAIPDLWTYGDKVLSKIRSSYFSFLFQNPNLIDYYTAGENMAFPLLLSDTPQHIAYQTISEHLSDLELSPEILNKRVQNLSGGQKQRIAFIRAIVSSYKILIADEPTGNLDIGTSHKLFQLLKKEIKNTAKTALVVSHNTDLALQYADYIYIIKENENFPNSANVFVPTEEYLNNIKSTDKQFVEHLIEHK